MSRKTNALAAGLVLTVSMSLAWGQTAAEDSSTSGTSARFANLLAYRDEARVFIDDKIAVPNTVNGEVSDFAPISSGQHRLKVVPRYGSGELLQQDFVVKAGSKTTLVLAGGPAESGAAAAPAAVIPLVSEKPSQAAAGNAPQVCTIVFANGDLRGPIKISAGSPGAQPASFDLPPGKTQTFEKFPLGALELRALPLFKLASGDDATAALDTFAPTVPATYYCIFYASGPNYPTRTLVLSTTTDGSLGASPIMDTR